MERDRSAGMTVSEALARRQSVRAFLPDPVPAAVVRDILERAARTPSGGNLQPWRVTALGGAALDRFRADIAAKLAAGVAETPAYTIYPPNLWEPLRSRRRETGAQRYAALGVSREEDGQAELTRRNYRFFDAPVGLFFCLDRRVGPPQWADLGMFMLSVMLLATERGLETCPQEAWSNWPDSIAAAINLPDHCMVFAGMSLGHADWQAPLNSYRTAREPFDRYAEMIGFEAAAVAQTL